MAKQEIKLSDHFTLGKLFRFVVPSIIMMIFTSIYGVIDGLFVSNYAGKIAFAAVNFIMPFPMMLGSFGFMLGTGGTAFVAKTLGEGRKDKAREYFSMIVKVTIAGGIMISILGFIFLRYIAIFLGADESILDLSVIYGRILLCGLPFFMLQNLFQAFLVTAEKPKLGLAVTVIAGVTNIVLDFLLVGVLHLGVQGAAVATITSEAMGGGIPLIYFIINKTNVIYICKSKMHWKVLRRVCLNGSSELMSNISMSLCSMLYNFQLMKFIGVDGVSAYGVIMYVGFVFVAVFIGYSIGSAPLVGYHYGADNRKEMQNLFRKSLGIIIVSGICMFTLAFFLSTPLAKIYVGYDADLFALTKQAFGIYALSYLIMGINIYGSAFFTALNNGVVSALISFLRTLVFQAIAVLILPQLFGADSIWYSVCVAECLALVVTTSLLYAFRNKYHYIRG